MRNLFNCGIYKITNLINGNIYIGKATNIKSRENSHFSNLNRNKHHNQHLQNAYNKYGKENFKFEIIQECARKDLINLEIYWIDYYQSFTNGYNMTKGGDGTLGLPCSEDAKRKMSEKQKGEKAYNYRRIFSDETKEKISNSLKGRKHTAEHKENLKKSLTSIVTGKS